MDVLIDSMAWLPKAELTHMQISAIKAALTITPKKFAGVPGPPPSPLYLFAEKEGLLGVPRSYFMERKKPYHNIIDRTTTGLSSLWDGPMAFVGDLRPEQEKAVSAVVDDYRAGGYGGMVKAVTGFGKCLRPDTLVLKYDGTLVRIDSLRVGDRLMGPDSTPRTVLAANSGFGPMYRITPVSGDPWECNDAHILTLVHTVTGEVQDIPLQDYLRLSASQKHVLKQFAPTGGVDFPNADPLPLDPYFVGIWYGDGTKALNSVGVSKPDAEIELLCWDTAAQFGLKVRTDYSGTCPTHHISAEPGQPNPLLRLLREIYADGAALPPKYLTASRADRRSFLAGWLDSDGHPIGGCYEVIQKRRAWAEGITFLARSLGLRANLRRKIVNGVEYWRVNLSGDFSSLPLRIARKLPKARLQKKRVTRTGFSVERIADGPYFGIVLDGDHRYLLGDFTVTHNTVCACAIMARIGVPTLVIVHKEFLMNQWRERIAQFLPGTRIGTVQQDVCDYKDCGVVLAMIHSLVGDRDYGQEFWNWPGLIIHDEAHRVGAETFSRAPVRFHARYRLGVSATPRRKDGCEDVFFYHLGPVLYTSHEQRMVPKIRRVWTDFKLVQTPTLNPSLVSKQLLLKFLCGNAQRNKTIVDQLLLAVVAGRKPIVLSERLQHLDVLAASFLREWQQKQTAPPPSVGFYVGGMKEEELDEAAKAQVIFATRQFAEEGLDIPALDTIFLTTPMSDVEQAVGRILRPCDGKKEPVVVDFRDDKVTLCSKAGTSRDRFYVSKGWS